jgi:hypothetical protein
VGGAAAISGCTPHVGDHCNLNSDCSLQGTLVCDNSQPNGYCTLFNCAPNSCQDQAACVLTAKGVPGCAYSDYQSPSRTARSMCLARCAHDSDCRTGDGYVCRDPTQPPWSAVILDNNNTGNVCLVNPGPNDIPASFDDAGICQLSGPPVPPLDAAVQSEDAPSDAAADGSGDAADAPGAADGNGPDSGDAGPDGAGESGTEGATDGGADGPSGD